jgi:hypothetical protein
MGELLILFKDVQGSRRTWSHHPSFRRASLRSSSSKRGGATKQIPALLTTQLLLLCSPRDTTNYCAFLAQIEMPSTLAGFRRYSMPLPGNRDACIFGNEAL